MADKQKNVEMSIEKMENTDLLKVYYHTLKRHLNNYPGGKSPVDKLFSEKMTRKNISNATLQAIQKGLQPFEDRITAKVKKNEIKNLPLNKGVTKGMFYKPKTVQFDPSVELCKKVLGKTGTIEIANKPGLFVGCNGFGLASYEKKYAKEGFLYPLARTSKNIGGIVFNFVPGLSDNQYVTIEVEKKPEYKLSCNGGFTWFTKDPQFGNSTKTFKIIPALNGKPFPWVSIESVASPEMYLAVSGPECLPQEWDLSGCFYFQKKCESNIALCNEIASFKINILGDIEEQPYSISLLGIKSEKCRDDIGNCMTPADWLWSCCDPEEPFVAWSVFGGNNFNAGVTEPAIDVDGGSYYGPYQQNTVLLDNRIVSGPLFLIAQVREDDDGGPSQKEVADAIIGGIDFLMSFASGDVLGSIQDGLEFAIDLGKVITDLLYGADDLYIPVVAYWSNSQELLKLTSGVEKTIDFESLINLCDKSVDHAAIKCANVVNSGGGKEWVLYFLIMRNEKGTNIW